MSPTLVIMHVTHAAAPTWALDTVEKIDCISTSKLLIRRTKFIKCKLKYLWMVWSYVKGIQTLSLVLYESYQQRLGGAVLLVLFGTFYLDTLMRKCKYLIWQFFLLHLNVEPMYQVRRLHQNVVPNFTVVNVEKPPGFLRKFSPDGRYFIAFSADQTSLEIYRYQGCQVPPPTENVSCWPWFKFF